MVEGGGKGNETDGYDQNTLCYAVQQSNNENVIRALIDAGADVNETCKYGGKTALFYAVKQSNSENVIRALIDAGADVNKTCKYGGKTALFYAVKQSNNENVVRALIDAGADVNKPDEYFQTALLYAVQQSNNEKVVGALIDAGADVNKTTSDGQTALLFAVKESNNENVVCALIHAGADVNKTDKNGKTVLFYAVQQSNNDNVVRALIDAGADVNITDSHGQTAIFYAINKGNNENVIRALIDAGADVSETNSYGQTALFYALQQSNNENVVRALINAGADVNKTYEHDQTALFYAVRQNNENLVRSLIIAGADVNKIDDNGRTTLFYAVQQNNNENVVCTLIETGNALVNTRDYYGRTPLFYAWKYPTTFEYLLERLNIQFSHLKDNCNVSIVTFIVENAASKHLDFLIKYGVKKDMIVKTSLNLMLNKMPLVTVSNQRYSTLSTVLDLASLCKTFLDFYSSAHKRLKKIVKMLESDRTIQCMLEGFQLLVELGADPNSADSDGNTALHYVTLLPLFDIPQDIVMDMCYKLVELGTSFNMKNHKGQTPLLFCLSFAVMRISGISLSAFKRVVDLCTNLVPFLVKLGYSMEETSRKGESVYHVLMKLFQKALEISVDTHLRGNVLHETMKLLQIFIGANVTRGNAVNKPDSNLNSPIHLWASLSPYRNDISDRIIVPNLETLLEEILQNLLKLGAILNPRNENEETPFHLCRTWSAVNLLLDAGANPKDLDSSGRSALLVAANHRTFVEFPDRLYPDVTKDPSAFWKTAIEKGLDPWEVDLQDDSVLSFLIQSGNYPLSKALVDVACEEKYNQSDTIFVSLLKSICKDTSTRNHWKSVLVQNLLKSRTSVFTIESTPLRFCCENLIREFGKADAQGFGSLYDDESFSEDKFKRTSKVHNSVHYEIAHLLICYGADPRSVDSSGKSCVDIAETCPILKDLLTKPIDINTIAVVIPWTSVSKKHEDRLAKVARRQEIEVVDSFWYHKDNIGSGSFGHVFAGINEKDGREVAIKRVETLRMTRPENRREITNLTRLTDCEQVVRYLHFLEKGHFSFVVLELMEGNLNDCFEGLFLFRVLPSITVEFCKDLVLGVKFLHEHNIIHRDLKPTNILYKTKPKLCLKIADFGLSQCIDIFGKTTVYSTNVGTRCWIAPEALKSGKHTKSSDVFSCGLLLHYIMSVQKHPFSPVDCAHKTEFKVAFETEANVLNGTIEGWDNSLSPEATDLVKKLLADEKNIIDRPTAKEAVQHPLFWSKEKKIDVLNAVGNQPEFECPRAKRTHPLNAVETDLEKNFGSIVRYGTWNDPGYASMPAIYTEMTPPRRRTYDTSSVVELVRFIRNAYAHVSEDTRPGPFRKMLLEDFVFLEYFPQLVVEVYKVITTYGWDQTKDEVKYAINK